jgi:hypothetical protein
VLVEATASGRHVLARARGRRIDVVATKLADLEDDDLELLERAARLVEERFALRAWRPLHRRPERGTPGADRQSRSV